MKDDDLVITKARWVPDLSGLEWVESLDARDREEIRLAWFYAQDAHGTSGHNRLLLIAKLADRLSTLEDVINSIEVENDAIKYDDFRHVINVLMRGETLMKREV